MADPDRRLRAALVAALLSSLALLLVAVVTGVPQFPDLRRPAALPDEEAIETHFERKGVLRRVHAVVGPVLAATCLAAAVLGVRFARRARRSRWRRLGLELVALLPALAAGGGYLTAAPAREQLAAYESLSGATGVTAAPVAEWTARAPTRDARSLGEPLRSPLGAAWWGHVLLLPSLALFALFMALVVARRTPGGGEPG